MSFIICHFINQYDSDQSKEDEMPGHVACIGEIINAYAISNWNT
jgi:hypothetical protein